MSFSIEDVRAQLSKLGQLSDKPQTGYENVPDQVISKFMARMAQKQSDAAPTPSSASPSVEPAPVQSVQSSNPLPPYPHTQQHPAHAKPFDPTLLPPPVQYVSPYANLALSNPQYSSLAQPAILHKPVSYVPNLPLSLRHNPAFLAQQTAYQPAPVFSQAIIPAHPLQAPSGSLQQDSTGVPRKSPAKSPSSSKKRSTSVTVEDGAINSEDEEDRADRELEQVKERQLQQLEERLKKHAAVAHGVRELIDPIHRAKENSPSNFIAQNRPSTAGARGGFGTARSDNLPQYAQVPERGSFQVPMKQQQQRSTRDAADDAVRAAQKELAKRGIQRSSSARSLSARGGQHSARPSTAALTSSFGRSSSTARLASRSENRRRNATEAWEQENHHPNQQEMVVEVVNGSDTQRSLRKTYKESVHKFKQLNPRYGDGGFRKSDPVTRYHAFKNKWDGSVFLNKKTTQLHQTGSTPVVQVKTPTWKA